MAGGFYLGSYFVQEYETENQVDWQMPLDGDFQHLRQTANVEELWVHPEDMDIPPEEIQVGPVEWVTFSHDFDSFYSSQPGPFGFYFKALGPAGFYVQALGI